PTSARPCVGRGPTPLHAIRTDRIGSNTTESSLFCSVTVSVLAFQGNGRWAAALQGSGGTASVSASEGRGGDLHSDRWGAGRMGRAPAVGRTGPDDVPGAAPTGARRRGGRPAQCRPRPLRRVVLRLQRGRCAHRRPAAAAVLRG